MKPLQPSKELAAVVGADPLSRPEVVSKVWDYIKRNNLQNPANKREINADDKLRVYRPRLVRHRIECYAASAAGESWFCRTAAGVWNPCRSMSQVVL